MCQTEVHPKSCAIEFEATLSGLKRMQVMRVNRRSFT
jgi:hypothetical protein